MLLIFRVFATLLMALQSQVLFLMLAHSYTSTLRRLFYSTVCSQGRKCFCLFIIQLNPWKPRLSMVQTFINSVLFLKWRRCFLIIGIANILDKLLFLSEKLIMNMISGKIKNFKAITKLSLFLSWSLAREMMKKSQEFNITYHPILDNFKEFNDVSRTKFDENLEFNFSSLLTTGNE